jgi:hypothetical protein
MKGPKTMAKKPLGPEGARFKKADWNPQATGSKGTYISERDALEARVAELEKVNGITVEVITVKPEHLKGSGPYVVRYLVDDAQRIEHDFYKKADRALENLMRERVQAALESNDFGSLASLGKLPPVAVIKSADGECFVPMPTAGIVRPSLPDLSRVNEGDEIFKVQLDTELYDQEGRAFAALGAAALEVAKSYRDATEFTPEDIASLKAQLKANDADRNKLREQISKDKGRVANATNVESKLGGFAIAAAIGWVAAIGLYIYSDLPIPFFGNDSQSAVSGIDNAALQACVSRINQSKQSGAPQELVDVAASVDRLPNGVFLMAARPADRNILRGMRLSDISTEYNYSEGRHSASISLTANNPPDNSNGNIQGFFVNFLLLNKDLERCTPLDEKSEYIRFEPRNNRGTFDEGVYGEPIYVGTARQINSSVSFTSGTPEGIPVVTYMAFTSQREVTR